MTDLRDFASKFPKFEPNVWTLVEMVAKAVEEDIPEICYDIEKIRKGHSQNHAMENIRIVDKNRGWAPQRTSRKQDCQRLVTSQPRRDEFGTDRYCSICTFKL